MSRIDLHGAHAADLHETAASGPTAAAHRHERPGVWRSSLIRHAAQAFAQHRTDQAGKAAQLRQMLQGAHPHAHGQPHPRATHPLPQHRQQQPHQQQQHQQRQPRQQQEHQQPKQKAKEPPRDGHHGKPGTAQQQRLARDAVRHDAIQALQWSDGRGGQNQGGYAEIPDARAKRRAPAITRAAAVERSEVQALARETHDRPHVYVTAIREMVIRQRCADHDPYSVTRDILKARSLADDYTRSGYDDWQSFLRDFQRLAAQFGGELAADAARTSSTGAGGGFRASRALLPLLAFHDLRSSSPALRQRAHVQLDAIGRARMTSLSPDGRSLRTA